MWVQIHKSLFYVTINEISKILFSNDYIFEKTMNSGLEPVGEERKGDNRHGR